MTAHRYLAAALLGLLLVSCGRGSTNRSQAAGGLRVKEIDLGSGLTADRRVIATDGTFSPADTLYAAVDLDGPVPASRVTARWIASDGTVVAEKTQSVTGGESEAVAQFRFEPPPGLKPGAYTIDIVSDGQVVGTKHFMVEPAAAGSP